MPSYDCPHCIGNLQSEIEEIPQHKQVQFSLETQLKAAQAAATRFGLYDAADMLDRLIRERTSS